MRAFLRPGAWPSSKAGRRRLLKRLLRTHRKQPRFHADAVLGRQLLAAAMEEEAARDARDGRAPRDPRFEDKRNTRENRARRGLVDAASFATPRHASPERWRALHDAYAAVERHHHDESARRAAEAARARTAASAARRQQRAAEAARAKAAGQQAAAENQNRRDEL